MPWLVLLASALLEAVWASALGASEGMSRPGPTALFLAATVLSVAGLARAMRHIPVGTAYAVWTGVGAVLTVAWEVLTGEASLGPVRALLLSGIVGCVVGLKLTEPAKEGTEPPPAPGA